jgi:hypothetical protein
MALASQSTRSERTAGTSRSRGGVTFILVTTTAVAAAAGAYYLLTGGPDNGGALRSASAASGMLAEVTLSDSVASSRRDALDSEAAAATRQSAATAASPSASAGSAPVGPIPPEAPAILLSEKSSTESDNSARTESSANPVVPSASPSDSPGSAPAGALPSQTRAILLSEKSSTESDNSARIEHSASPTDTLDPIPSAPQSPPVPPADKPADPTTTPAFGNGLDSSAPQAPAAQPPASPAEAKLREGLALAATEPVKARLLLSQAVLSNTLAEPEARQAADALSRLSAQLFLTPVFNANDPICTQYTIQPNDSLEKIVRKQKLGCDWRLVARINRIKNPAAIQVGKRLKLPVGPFSAVVSKRDYRIYLCTGTGDDRVVVAALAVGLGEANGTPTGRFKVRANSKLINPEWTHPVTGQRYEADDPANPIGEYWLGIEGVEDSNSALLGYGIHGTIDNDSIGHDRSLGCVRLLADDVALVWETLAEGSAVEIWRGAGS